MELAGLNIYLDFKIIIYYFNLQYINYVSDKYYDSYWKRVCEIH